MIYNACMNKRLEACLTIKPDRRPNLKASYTLAELESLYASSNGVCQICGKPQTGFKNGGQKNLAIDHCHKTGKVRGLLCTKCNTALGKFNDDPSLLRKAAEYLDKSNSNE